MRIVVANWTSRKAGGAEAYLDTIIPELYQRGHDLAFLWESDVPVNYAPIRLLAGSKQWTASEIDRAPTIDAVRDWRPDLIYMHRLDDPALEAAMLQVAPAVLFAHDYSRTCISGAKTFKFPIVTPCKRRFGWKCLVHYYPHRCGGLNPVTMWRLYRSRSERRPLLNMYSAIVTASDHMRDEFLKNGLPARSVHKIPFPVRQSESGHYRVIAKREWNPGGDLRLLFVGRMVPQKGGLTLLEALRHVVRALKSPIRMTFVGDGPEQRVWQAKASSIEASEKHLRIEFAGWLEKTKLDGLFDESDLLIVPSLWPEPFGLVGIEAGSCGVPGAAFAVGGVREWLVDGVNGYLARADPPTAAGLSEAIVKCLHDPEEHARLRRGAVDIASRFTAAAHVSKLFSVFEAAAKSAGRPCHPLRCAILRSTD